MAHHKTGADGEIRLRLFFYRQACGNGAKANAQKSMMQMITRSSFRFSLRY